MECSNCQYGMYPYDEPLAFNAEVCPRCGEPFTKEEDKDEMS